MRHQLQSLAVFAGGLHPQDSYHLRIYSRKLLDTLACTHLCTGAPVTNFARGNTNRLYKAHLHSGEFVVDKQRGHP